VQGLARPVRVELIEEEGASLLLFGFADRISGSTQGLE
jgi:hypothetical protein